VQLEMKYNYLNKVYQCKEGVKVKAKWSLFLLIKHYAMKAYGGVGL
jgi:hypothetical protein